MRQLVQYENIAFDHNEIKHIFEKTDSDKSFRVNQLVFYPYYYFEYKLTRKSLFHPNGGVIGCAVDGVNGTGAIANTFPRLQSQEIQTQTMITEELNLSDAKTTAKKFVYDSISYKMKVFSAPPVNLTKEEKFYRPYWIIEGGDRYSQNKFMLTVDAVTGKYHPL